MSSNNIPTAILRTLAFYDLYSFPLTNIELFDNLWGVRAEYQQVRSSLATMVSQKQIDFADGFYFLPGRAELVAIRRRRHLASIKKTFQLERDKWLFSLAPFIDMIGIANTLAYSNAKPDGDIDILVVTRPGRLFTARLFLTFWLFVFNRWRHGSYISNRYCLSFFLTADNLNLQPLQFPDVADIYLIYWTKWLVPFYCPNTLTVADYFTNNQWIKSYLPNTNFLNTNSHADQPSYFAKFFELLLDGGLGDWFESFLSRIMMSKIKAKSQQFDIDGIMASTQILKFHPTGRRRHYQTKWEQNCHKYQI